MYRAGMKLAAVVLALGTAWGQTAAPAPPAKPATPAPPAKAPKAPRAPSQYRGSYLGVDTRDVTPERAAALKLKNPGGVEVTMVDQDAPAGKAGLRDHDVIQTINGKKVNDREELARIIRGTAPGTKITIGIVRDGQPQSLTAQLAARNTYEYAFTAPNGKRMHVVVPDVRIAPMPPMDFDVPQFTVLQFWSRNGVVVEDLTPQLGEFFGVRNGEGVLVRSVEKGSAAAAAGLKAGDVITKINGESVGCSADWRQAMRERKGGNVTVSIVRDKREQTLSMKLPEPRSSSVFPSEDFDRQMEQMRRELERMGPQIERANALAERDVQRAMEELQRQMERSQAERERQMERAERERERAQEQAERKREQAERAREKAQRDLQRKLEEQQRKQEQQQEEQQRKLEQQQQQTPK